MQKYETSSEQETKQLAKKLSRDIKNNIIALTGELGAGKTIFSQGFAKGFGIKEKIISPTFVLIRQHQIPASPASRLGEPDTKKVLYHIDLYRLEDIKDLKELGLEEILSDPKNIVLIEWAEKISDSLPDKVTYINIQKDGSKRIITIS